MATDFEHSGEILSPGRNETFELANSQLGVAHETLSSAIAGYNQSFATYSDEVVSALRGATIVVAKAWVAQERWTHEWKQVSKVIENPAEMQVSNVTVYKRVENLEVNEPGIWVTAIPTEDPETAKPVRFWLQNAEWSFKPDVPTD